MSLYIGIIAMVVGLAVVAVVAVLIVISRKKKKEEMMAMYRRPHDLAKPQGTYYEPEDNTMAPTAYGSMTYATNTYGQNLYGQEPAVGMPNNVSQTVSNTNPLYGTGPAANMNLQLDEGEDPSGLSLEFLKRSDEERWRREHESFQRPSRDQNMNPLYGTMPTDDSGRNSR